MERLCVCFDFCSPHYTVSPLSNDIYDLVISADIEGCMLQSLLL